MLFERLLRHRSILSLGDVHTTVHRERNISKAIQPLMWPSLSSVMLTRKEMAGSHSLAKNRDKFLSYNPEP
jgi:hypothetical protein